MAYVKELHGHLPFHSIKKLYRGDHLASY